MPERALATIQVGDGMPDADLGELAAELQARVHHAAAAHYGRTSDCHYRTFAAETPDDGRTAFAALLETMFPGHESNAKHLAEWDGSARPVAVVHWWVE